VDDFVVFSPNRQAAKETLILLTGVLRRRGMSIQTAKTAIHSAEEAREHLDQVTPVLRVLAGKYAAEIAEQLGIEPTYLSVARAEQLLAASHLQAPLGLIEDAFRERFIEVRGEFNKTLFHFLLRRLAKGKSTFAVGYCLGLLEEHPEETAEILRYLEAVTDVVSVEPNLLDYFTSPTAVYVYQRYQLIRWRAQIAITPSSAFVDHVREVNMRHSAAFLRAVCRQFLGRYGTVADLEQLEDDYNTAVSPIERAEVVCSLARLELSRRNAILGMARAEGELTRRAAILVSKSLVA
jgi:hypothetical protein